MYEDPVATFRNQAVVQRVHGSVLFYLYQAFINIAIQCNPWAIRAFEFMHHKPLGKIGSHAMNILINDLYLIETELHPHNLLKYFCMQFIKVGTDSLGHKNK